MRYGTCRYIEQVVELYFFPSILLLALYPWHHKRFIFLFFFLSVCALIGPIAFAIIVIGNSAIILGLWSAHAVWTYYCVARLYFLSKLQRLCSSLDLSLQFLFTLLKTLAFDNRKNRFGLVFKLVVLMGLPVPLLLWPIVGIVGSLLGGIGYGFFAPLLATFQAVGEGENVNQKFYHCFIDGCWSTIERSCTVVQDVTDFCFHSYFSYMDELRENLPPHEKLLDIRLSLLPCCLLVIMVGVSFDMALIISIAIWKSPYMLFKGWKRLLEDLIGIKGPFLETECVPFAGLAIILWPLAVVVAEDSVEMGFIYIVSVVSLFDEYVSDLLYLREGSCFPRPIYRRNMSHAVEGKNLGGGDNDLKNRRDGSQNSKHSIQQSRSMKWGIQQCRPVQSCEVNGRILLRGGLISVGEVEKCILKGNCKKLSIKLPAWSLLQCLLTSAKSNSDGSVISYEVVLTRTNGPKDRVFEWFIGPLLIMKEQLKNLELEGTEETCLKELVMKCKNEVLEESDSTGFPSDNTVRRAQLQAIIRRYICGKC
ncbi:putative membrane protein [Glycine max]|nr:putative membrane protein [Glycine max]